MISNTIATERNSNGDADAVGELITDIEAEIRLHQARVQEFLEGTPEFSAVTDMRARAMLLRTKQALIEVLDSLSELAE